MHCQFCSPTTVLYNYMKGKNLNHLFSTINADLALLSDWFKANKLVLNANKTIYDMVSFLMQHMDSMNMNITIDSA